MHAKQIRILETKFPNTMQLWKLDFQRDCAFTLQHNTKATHDPLSSNTEIATKQVQTSVTSVQGTATT
jgi:hypothetical protein